MSVSSALLFEKWKEQQTAVEQMIPFDWPIVPRSWGDNQFFWAPAPE